MNEHTTPTPVVYPFAHRLRKKTSKHTSYDIRHTRYDIVGDDPARRSDDTARRVLLSAIFALPLLAAVYGNCVAAAISGYGKHEDAS